MEAIFDEDNRKTVIFVIFALLIGIVVIVILVASSGEAGDPNSPYCNVTTCEKNTHTMCKHKKGPAKACNEVISNGLTKEEGKKIVQKHNELRQKVARGEETRGNPGPQPAAASMPDLVWDDELAEIAQRWAEQCNYEHDKCRSVERFSVGQNLAKTSESAGFKKFKAEDLVQMWYDEVKDHPRSNVDSFKSQPIYGHYTQFVWAKTTLVGCGATKYKVGGWYNFVLACNYGPTGNVIGAPIYESVK